MRHALIACTAMLLGSLALGAEPEPVALQWQLAPGRTLRYRVESQQRSTHRLGDETYTTRQDLSVDWTLVVEDLQPDRTALVRLRYDAIRLDLDLMATGRLSWDSTRREDQLRARSPLVRPYAALLGHEIRFALRPDGTVVPGSLRGLDTLRARLAEELGGGVYVEATVLPMLADETVRADLESALRLAPPEPVGPGARWQHEIVRPAPPLGALRLVRTCRLEGLQDGVAELALGVAIEPVAEAAAAKEQPAVYGATAIEWLEGGGRGRARLSAREGRLLESTLTLQMRLRVRPERRATGLAEQPAAAPVEVRVEQKVRVQALD